MGRIEWEMNSRLLHKELQVRDEMMFNCGQVLCLREDIGEEEHSIETLIQSEWPQRGNFVATMRKWLNEKNLERVDKLSELQRKTTKQKLWAELWPEIYKIELQVTSAQRHSNTL